MIRKSGNRFSEKIMLQQNSTRPFAIPTVITGYLPGILSSIPLTYQFMLRI